MDHTFWTQHYRRYLRVFAKFTQNRLYPDNHNPNQIDKNIWYHQDGSSSHFTDEVRAYLNEVFPNRWRCNRVASRSPDMILLVYFLWGCLKSKLYVNGLNNIENLKITKAIHLCPSRKYYCQEANGFLFEHSLVFFNMCA